ncbi:MAG: hypothetical protein KF819_34580 [Labilithrix sp.]|nr:hypothetical protein [Labilithrix sp.]
MGCGGSDGTGTVGPADGGAETGPGPGPAIPDPDGGPEGGGPTADAGDGGTRDDRIDPIEVGRSWTYNVQVLGIYPLCTNGVHTSAVLQKAGLDGKTAFDVQSFCPSVGVVKYAVEGDRVFVHFGGAWVLSLDAPVAENHTWTDGLLNYKWEKKGTVTVTAGTFSDCWQATTVASYTSYIQLCRGVGPVKWHYEDGFGNGYEAILVSKNF